MKSFFIKPGTGRTTQSTPMRVDAPLTEVDLLDALAQERQAIDAERVEWLRAIESLYRRGQGLADALDNAPAAGAPINHAG